MPYVSEGEEGELGFDDIPQIQSDVLYTVEPDINGSQADSESIGGDLPAEVNPTVVTLDDEPGLNEGAPFPDMGIHEPVREASTPGSGLKKRGRPSRSASATPARTPAKTPKSSKTPRTAKSAAAATPKSNTGRKRKAAEVEENEEQAGEDNSEPAPAEPPVKRGRPGRKAAAAAPASARLAAKVANKPTRGRPKATSTEDKATAAAAKKPAKGKAGRPAKAKSAETNGVVPKGQYEVEEIVESQIDAETMQHMYFVKWKGYSSDENTWEPKQNLLPGAADLVAEFDKKKKATAQADDAKPKATRGGRPKANEKKDEKAAGEKVVKQTEKKTTAKPETKRGRPAGRPGRKAKKA